MKNNQKQRDIIKKILDYLNSDNKPGMSYRGEYIIDKYIREAIDEARFWLSEKKKARANAEKYYDIITPKKAEEELEKVRKNINKNKEKLKKDIEFFRKIYIKNRYDKEVRSICNDIMKNLDKILCNY